MIAPNPHNFPVAQEQFKKQAKYLATSVVAIALFALFNWYFGLHINMSPIPNMEVMGPVVAMCFLLAGVCLLLLAFKVEKPIVETIIYALSILLLLTALANLVLISFGYDTDLTKIFHAGKVNETGIATNMTTITSISFFLIGTCIILWNEKKVKSNRLAQYVSLVVFVATVFILVGHIYNAKEFYGWLKFISMPGYTALAFILIILSGWCLNWNVGFVSVVLSKNSGGTMARILLPFTIIFPVIVGYGRIFIYYEFPISLELGVTLLITTSIFLFLLLILYVSSVINRKDDLMKLAEAELAANNQVLEQKVIERTEELFRNEKSFRALIDHNSSAISLMDANFNIIYRSPSAIQITGFTDEERHRLGAIEQIHPDDIQRVLKSRKEVLENPGKAIQYFFRTKHKNGNYIWMEGTLTNMLHERDVCAIIINMHDVTERVESEMKIKESNTNLNAIFKNISEGITFIDKNYIIKSFNERALTTALLSNSKPLSIGTSILDYIEENRKHFFEQTISKVLKGESIEYDRALTKEGQAETWYEVALNPVKEEGDVIGVCLSSRDITEKKLAEERLASSERRFRALIENMADSIMLTDENLKVYYQSPSVERLTGISLDRRKSKPGIQYTHPDDFEMIKNVVEESLLKPGKPIPYQSRMLHMNGNYIWIEGVATNLLQDQSVKAIAFNYRDVTERKKLEDQQALLVSIVNSSDDAIISRTLDGIILSWNNGAEKIYNYTAAETVGKHISMLIPPSLMIEEPLIIEKIKSGRSIDHYETRRMKKGGELIYVSLTVSPIKDIKGNIIGASKIARDISERKKSEEVILKLNVELEERVALRTAQLQEVNKEMESFAYSVSHDLRSPLRIINGYSQILLEDYGKKFDSEAHRILNVITSNAVRMGSLIDDLLNFSRLGKTEIVKAGVDMNNIVNDVVHELRLSGVKIPGELKINNLKRGFCDANLIKHVWMNLISNAFKYSSGKVNAQVEVGMAEDDEKDIYYVKDNGAGFDMLYHDKLFGVFQRLHKIDEFPGTGVGLAIVHRIISRHGGTVWAEAKVNEGATFYFTL